jgi:hypothetical protein
MGTELEFKIIVEGKGKGSVLVGRDPFDRYWIALTPGGRVFKINNADTAPRSERIIRVQLETKGPLHRKFFEIYSRQMDRMEELAVEMNRLNESMGSRPYSARISENARPLAVHQRRLLAKAAKRAKEVEGLAAAAVLARASSQQPNRVGVRQVQVIQSGPHIGKIYVGVSQREQGIVVLSSRCELESYYSLGKPLLQWVHLDTIEHVKAFTPDFVFKAFLEGLKNLGEQNLEYESQAKKITRVQGKRGHLPHTVAQRLNRNVGQRKSLRGALKKGPRSQRKKEPIVDSFEAPAEPRAQDRC